MSFLGKRSVVFRQSFTPELPPLPSYQQQAKRRPRLDRRDSFLDDNLVGGMADSRGSVTLFRFLCPSESVGAVLGRGGSIIKGLRESTGATITMQDGTRGARERELIVSCKDDVPVADREAEDIDLSAAQVALLKIHQKVSGQDPDAEEDTEVTAQPDENVVRLLIAGSQVGPILGKGGSVINHMREASGAQIRLLGREQLPPLAKPGDDLLQMTGDYESVHKALTMVLACLRAHPPRNNPGQQGSNASPNLLLTTLVAPQSPGSPVAYLPPTGAGAASPSVSMLGVESPGSGPVVEVTFRVLCPDERVGVIIGKGGAHVRQVQQDTGANIQVEEKVEGCDDRVITISGKEPANASASGVEEALLRVASKIIEEPRPPRGADSSETGGFRSGGSVPVRLLVARAQTGSILGRGGANIAQIRQTSGAQVKVFTDSGEVPACGDEDDHLVQVSGEVYAMAIALRLISAQLRQRLSAAPLGLSSPSLTDYSRASSGRSLAPSALNFDARVPAQQVNSLPQALGTSTVMLSVPGHLAGSVIGKAGANIEQIRSISGAKVSLQNGSRGDPERIVEISGTADQIQSAQALVQAFVIKGQAQGPPSAAVY